MGQDSIREGEEEREKNYDLYYAVFYDEPRDVHYLLKIGANPNYCLPGKSESALELAKRLNKQGKICSEIKKMLGI